MFKDRNFVSGCIFMIVMGLVLFSTMALASPYLQNVAGYPVTTAGLLLASRGVGNFISMLLVGRMMRHFEARTLIIVGLVLTAGSLFQMTAWTDQTTVREFVTVSTVQGFGFGFVFVPLQRHSGGVSLTLAGQGFLRHARIILRQIDDSVRDIAAMGRSEEGCIKVGIFSSLASGFLFELLRAFNKDHAGVLVELINGNPSEHVAAVRQLQIDVAFITGTSAWPGCETAHLWSERVFAVLPSKHVLACKDALDWSDLVGESFIVSDVAPGPEIHDYLVQRLAELGRHPEVQPQYVGRDNLLSLVAVGQGMTLISEATTVAQIPGITYRPITNEVLPFSAVWSPKNDNPACRRLLSLARSMARSGRRVIKPPASAK